MNAEEYTIKITEVINDPLYSPLYADNLAALIGVPEEDYGKFRELVAALGRAGLLQKTKRGKIMPYRTGTTSGVFHGTSKGFGFVTPDVKKPEYNNEDFFIPFKNTLYALDGDRVLVRIIDQSNRGRKEHFDKSKFKRDKNGKMIPVPEKNQGICAEIVQITERAISSRTVIGVYCVMSEKRHKKTRLTAWVQPDAGRLPYSILVNADKAEELGVSPGDKVEVKVTKFPSDNSDLWGEIIRTFGDSGSRKANYEAILAENGIEQAFPDKVLEESEQSSSRKITPEGRLNLTDKIIFTIDGADAKDLDDAISLDVTPDGYRLGVHIADVSEYVTEGSLTDAEAIKRGTSVYFADKVVPMLPKCLSNGSCSLGGGFLRYALSAFITLSSDGEILKTELYESIIRSKVRGVYDEINDIFTNGASSKFAEKYKEVIPTLSDMLGLYKILKKKSERRGAVALDTQEAYIEVSESGNPIAIRLRERGDAERMIEQFMLAANEGVATRLTEKDLPCVYRVHEEPTQDKLEAFSAFLSGVGIDTRPLRVGSVTPAVFSDILKAARKKGIEGIVSGVMLRAMMKAKYVSEPAPHFGLATKLYCHFTSPIRRYPDLSVHRIVKSYMHGMNDSRKAELSAFAAKSAFMSVENELRTLNAERSIEDLYKAVYMADHVGEEFDGIISSVTSFGLFVALPNTVEGLIPTELMAGKCSFNEKHYELTCAGKTYKLGQPIHVSVVSVDISSRRITMAEE